MSNQLERLDTGQADRRIIEMARMERLTPWEKAIYQENSLRLDEAPKPVSLLAATLGWIFILSFVLLSGFYILLFAIKRGPSVSWSWLSCFLQAIAVEICVVVPMKVLIFNVALPGNKHLSHKLKSIDFAKVSASEKLCKTVSDAPGMAPKAMKLLAGSGIDDQPDGGTSQRHFTMSPLEHGHAHRLLSAILVTKSVGRSFLLPSKAMFTPFGIVRYTVDVIVPVVTLSASFRLIQLYWEAPGFAIFLTITALVFVVLLTLMALGRTWSGATGASAGLNWTNINVRRFAPTTSAREAAVENNRKKNREQRQTATAVDQAMSEAADDAETRGPGKGAFIFGSFVPRWKRRHQQQQSRHQQQQSESSDVSNVVDVSHLLGRTSEAQRTQSELHHTTAPISPMDRRRAHEDAPPLDISRMLAIRKGKEQDDCSVNKDDDDIVMVITCR
jgi:hypothetical protein